MLQLENAIKNKTPGYKHTISVDWEFRNYKLEFKYYQDKKILVIDNIRIDPMGTGGLKELLQYLNTMPGIREVVIGKVINARLAEYLAKEGWTLKASSSGNWINFHKKI